MSSRSLSLIAGSASESPGRFTPLRSPSSPVFRISVSTSVSLTFSNTRRQTAPSSSSTSLPGATVSTSSLYETQILSRVPSSANAGSVVSVSLSPCTSVTRPPSTSCAAPAPNLPERISGPFVSSITARGSSCSDAARFSRRISTSSSVAWLKLIRMMRMPACTQSSSGCFVSDAGPMVATIFTCGNFGCTTG